MAINNKGKLTKERSQAQCYVIGYAISGTRNTSLPGGATIEEL